jgi:hypothetical protein
MLYFLKNNSSFYEKYISHPNEEAQKIGGEIKRYNKKRQRETLPRTFVPSDTGRSWIFQ